VNTAPRPSERIVHVMVLDKFIPRYIEFVGEHFDLSEHRFCLMGQPRYEHGLTPQHPVSWIASAEDHVDFVATMQAAKRILLHGLWSDQVNRILYALPALARKAHWIIWGGDLYQTVPTEPSPGWLHQEIIRQGVISQLQGLVGIPGDMALAQKRYNGPSCHASTFIYPSNLAPREVSAPTPHEGVNVLVGHSATETNCHLDAFALIARHDQGDLRVHCPLSYGDARYRDIVIANGHALFGQRFHPMTDMLPLPAYQAFLAGIDIAVMHHNRQQGMGNLVSLLTMGKKVYMRADQTHARFLASLGLTSYDMKDFCPEPMPEATRVSNMEIARAHFSAKNLARDMGKLFAQTPLLQTA
jgi:dTDP-N-acetylfucosamine:lipid II N-acetylfucosaminyltransferase